MKKRLVVIPVLISMVALTVTVVFYVMPHRLHERTLKNRITEMYGLVIEQEYEELFRKYMYPEFQKVFFEIKSHEEFASSLTPHQKDDIEKSFSYIANANPTFKYQRRIAYFYSPDNLARISFVRMHQEESWYFIIDLAQEIGQVDRYIENDT